MHLPHMVIYFPRIKLLPTRPTPIDTTFADRAPHMVAPHRLLRLRLAPRTYFDGALELPPQTRSVLQAVFSSGAL